MEHNLMNAGFQEQVHALLFRDINYWRSRWFWSLAIPFFLFFILYFNFLSIQEKWFLDSILDVDIKETLVVVNNCTNNHHICGLELLRQKLREKKTIPSKWSENDEAKMRRAIDYLKANRTVFAIAFVPQLNAVGSAFHIYETIIIFPIFVFNAAAFGYSHCYAWNRKGKQMLESFLNYYPIGFDFFIQRGLLPSAEALRARETYWLAFFWILSLLWFKYLVNTQFTGVPPMIENYVANDPIGYVLWVIEKVISFMKGNFVFFGRFHEQL